MILCGALEPAHSEVENESFDSLEDEEEEEIDVGNEEESDEEVSNHPLDNNHF